MANRSDKKVVLGQYYTSEEVCDFMVGLASVPRSSRVLDSGCGEGAFINSLLKAEYSDVTAYDIDENNCTHCSLRYGKQATIIRSDYLETPRDDLYDLIIGNPPYVQWNNINPEIRKKLREDPFWSQHSNGEWDLLYAFIVWSVEKLRKGGDFEPAFQFIPISLPYKQAEEVELPDWDAIDAGNVVGTGPRL